MIGGARVGAFVLVMIVAILIIIGGTLAAYVPWAAFLGWFAVLMAPVAVVSAFHPFYVDIVFRALRGGKILLEMVIRRGEAERRTPWGRCTVNFAEGVEVCEAGNMFVAFVRLGLYAKPPPPEERLDEYLRRRMESIVMNLRSLVATGRPIGIEILSVPDVVTAKVVEEKIRAIGKAETTALSQRFDVLKALHRLASRGLISRNMIVVTVSGSGPRKEEAINIARALADSVKTAFSNWFRVEVLRGAQLATYIVTRVYRPPATLEEVDTVLSPLIEKSSMR